MKADFEKGIKVCSRCNQELSISEFYKDKQQKDGLSSYCKKCKSKIWNYKMASEESKQNKKEYRSFYNRKEEVKEKAKIRRDSEEMKQYMKNYFSSEKGKEILRKNNLKRKENGKQNDWFKRKRQADSFYIISQRFRARLYQCLKKESSKSEEILNCSWNEFKQHIESQFQEGMSWENRSDWDIDHIIPVSYFKRINEDMKVCFHYLNLQPLWKEENRWKKKCEIPDNYLERIEGIKSYINSYKI